MKTYRFGSCEMRLSTREVLLDGKVQLVEPRVFAFLTYLIEQRPRVVTKAELLEVVWGHAHLSEGVLSRAALLARRAIGDATGDAGWIKTVHRVGYRFTGTLQEQPPAMSAAVSGGPADSDTASAADPAPVDGALAEVPATLFADSLPALMEASVPPPAAVSVCLLPFGNDTQDAMLSWVTLGFMTLVTHALERDRRIAVMPPLSLLSTLRQLPVGQTHAEQIAALHGLLGVQYVVQARVSRAGDRFTIHFDGSASAASSFSGVISGTELTALGPVLASQISAHIFPHADALLQFHSPDPFATDAFGRALQAIAEDRWTEGARLLDVVLDIEPGNAFARLMRLRTLVHRNEPSAFAEGARLLEKAQTAGNQRVLATIHSMLALAHLQSDADGAVQRAHDHMTHAIHLVQGQPAADWTAEILLGSSLVCQLSRNFDDTLMLCGMAETQSIQAGNQLRQGLILTRRGSTLSIMGERQEARRLIEQAVQLHQKFRLHDRAVVCHALLAQITAWLGDFDAARMHCRVTWESTSILRDPRAVYFAAAWAGAVHADLREPEPIDAFLLAFGLPPDQSTALAQLVASLLLAQQALARNQHEDAVQPLWRVYDEALRLGADTVAYHCAPSLLQVLARLQDWPACDALCEQLQSLLAQAGDVELQGCVLHVQALQAHAHDESDFALQCLLRASHLMPLGRWRAYVRFDAAWLCIERADLLAARNMLSDLDGWMHHHPLGLLVAARLAAAEGRLADAWTLYERQKAHSWLTDADYANALEGVLQPGAVGQALNTWPTAPRLPSIL